MEVNTDIFKHLEYFLVSTKVIIKVIINIKTRTRIEYKNWILDQVNIKTNVKTQTKIMKIIFLSSNILFIF